MASGSALGLQSSFDLMVDADLDTATGCTVTAPEGSFTGIETIYRTQVFSAAGGDATVSAIERHDCVDPGTNTFGPAQLVDAGGWPVGIGNGEDGFNVIETYIPLGSGEAANSIRIGLIASDELDNTGALFTSEAGGDGAIILGGVSVAGIPVLGAGGLVLTGVLLMGAGMATFRRRRRATLASIALLASGGAIGAVGVLDGNTAGWTSADLLATTNVTDSASGVDIRALFGRTVVADGRRYFRIDAALQFPDANTTLSPSASALMLSVNDASADPVLGGSPRTITFTNTGGGPANDLQTSVSGFPAGTSVSGNTCTGTLGAGSSCAVTITPGATASPDAGANACTTAPGSEPVPTTLSLVADNAPQVDVDVLVVGYGCIVRGGYLFAVDDTTPSTGSIGGKVSALADEGAPLRWSTVFVEVFANSISDGAVNTALLAAGAPDSYPAGQACVAKNAGGFTDWYLPAICEMGRSTSGIAAGCGSATPNLFTTLHSSNLGGFAPSFYWSSTEGFALAFNDAWQQSFASDTQFESGKASISLVRCVRAFAP
jgi:hypothetical protein